MKTLFSKYLLSERILNQRGQSAVEYIIVTGFIVTALVTLPSLYDTFSHTMHDKFQSYAFGISISDPPSKAFDDEVHKVSEVLGEIEKIFSELWDMIKDLTLHGKVPSLSDIKKVVSDILNLITGL